MNKNKTNEHSKNKKRNSGQRNHKGRGRYQNRSRRSKGPKLTEFEKAERGHINLMEIYMNARRKYFELYHRANQQQLDKLERLFNKARTDLRTYESKLTPELAEAFKLKFDGLKVDSTYSDNHQLKADSYEVSHDPNNSVEDPHYLISQKESKYADDTEESIGSLDDYKSYKGLT